MQTDAEGVAKPNVIAQIELLIDPAPAANDGQIEVFPHGASRAPRMPAVMSCFCARPDSGPQRVCSGDIRSSKRDGSEILQQTVRA